MVATKPEPMLLPLKYIILYALLSLSSYRMPDNAYSVDLLVYINEDMHNNRTMNRNFILILIAILDYYQRLPATI